MTKQLVEARGKWAQYIPDVAEVKTLVEPERLEGKFKIGILDNATFKDVLPSIAEKGNEDKRFASSTAYNIIKTIEAKEPSNSIQLIRAISETLDTGIEMNFGDTREAIEDLFIRDLNSKARRSNSGMVSRSNFDTALYTKLQQAVYVEAAVRKFFAPLIEQMRAAEKTGAGRALEMSKEDEAIAKPWLAQHVKKVFYTIPKNDDYSYVGEPKYMDDTESDQARASSNAIEDRWEKAEADFNKKFPNAIIDKDYEYRLTSKSSDIYKNLWSICGFVTFDCKVKEAPDAVINMIRRAKLQSLESTKPMDQLMEDKVVSVYGFANAVMELFNKDFTAFGLNNGDVSEVDPLDLEFPEENDDEVFEERLIQKSSENTMNDIADKLHNTLISKGYECAVASADQFRSYKQPCIVIMITAADRNQGDYQGLMAAINDFNRKNPEFAVKSVQSYGSDLSDLYVICDSSAKLARAHSQELIKKHDDWVKSRYGNAQAQAAIAAESLDEGTSWGKLRSYSVETKSQQNPKEWRVVKLFDPEESESTVINYASKEASKKATDWRIRKDGKVVINKSTFEKGPYKGPRRKKKTSDEEDSSKIGIGKETYGRN